MVKGEFEKMIIIHRKKVKGYRKNHATGKVEKESFKTEFWVETQAGNGETLNHSETLCDFGTAVENIVAVAKEYGVVEGKDEPEEMRDPFSHVRFPSDDEVLKAGFNLRSGVIYTKHDCRDTDVKLKSGGFISVRVSSHFEMTPMVVSEMVKKQMEAGEGEECEYDGNQ